MVRISPDIEVRLRGKRAATGNREVQALLQGSWLPQLLAGLHIQKGGCEENNGVEQHGEILHRSPSIRRTLPEPEMILREDALN
jgi:hypothetical protein